MQTSFANDKMETQKYLTYNIAPESSDVSSLSLAQYETVGGHPFIR
ncbi:MAG: hypothetical protein IPN99_13805 [Bacteroidetes bacterium]|nr:hypothetical protein [Bacteroidota bacterium]